LDYGFNWALYKVNDTEPEDDEESIISQQLKYFYEKYKDKKGYIKALYLHHLLDFFKETHVNIYDIDLVFEKFLQNKVIVEITDTEGKKLSFQQEVEEIFKLLKDNKKELYEDIKGNYTEDFKNEYIKKD
jgi:hypothetical protein